eukprot:2029715-Prymnesium_polylepis.1
MVELGWNGAHQDSLTKAGGCTLTAWHVDTQGLHRNGRRKCHLATRQKHDGFIPLQTNTHNRARPSCTMISNHGPGAH